MSSATPTFTPPSGYNRIKVVASFDELVSTPFAGDINALCWPRTLPGDFAEVARLLSEVAPAEGVVTLNEARLLALPVSAAGRIAIELMIADLRLLRAHDLDPALNCIHGYPRDEDGGPVPTDVFSFHVDSAPIPAATWLCTYHGPASDGLRNDKALRRVDVPETRAELLKLYGGQDDAGFRAYLHENCFDLHYAAVPQAQPFAFGLAHLWRIATEYPGSPVPPCIHRAPTTRPGQPPRLLLIS